MTVLSTAKIGFGISAAICAVTVATAAPQAPSYSIVDRIAGADGGWDFTTFDPIRNRLYVARSNAVMKVDLASGVVTPMLAPAIGGHQVLVVRNGSEVVETDGKTNLARFIDADTGQVMAEIPTGKKPDAALVDPATGLVVVMNPGDGTVSLIDPVTRTMVGSITVGGGLEVGAADGKGLVYVNVEDKNEVAILDIRKRTVIGRYALTGCEGPTGLAFVAGGKRLISSCANNIAAISDPVSRKVTGTVMIGKKPDGVVYDAKRGLAFIPTGEGFLEILSAAQPNAIKIVGRLATMPSAKTIAFDPATGRIYLPGANILPPVAPATRGQAEPGSFKILVIAPAA
jgi:DNA-binding beta-propeller fold protein YncE